MYMSTEIKTTQEEFRKYQKTLILQFRVWSGTAKEFINMDYLDPVNNVEDSLNGYFCWK